MTTIYIDGKAFNVNPQHNLLQICLANGLDLPYFCWHPALGSVGSCRQCAIKQYANPDDKTGRLVMACMTPVTDGTRISLADPEAKSFRASVIEWMMTNHPHDCPVCEEGGECHLQDMTVPTGHTYRRYRFTKRTHKNQHLGPFIKHEMNRCIACYRCVRFYSDYAGGTDLDVHGAHNNIYFGRDTDGTLLNEFSGNLVEVCPTGVFTDKTLSSAYNRKWDMRSLPSVCVHCGAGCNIFVSEHGGQVRRILNRFNGQVNGFFLCDRGRFGYGFTNTHNHLLTPAIHEAGNSSQADILETIAKQLSGSNHIIGIGSPRASLEANFALRSLVGEKFFYPGNSQQDANCLMAILDILTSTSIKTATTHDIETADAVLILGEDITNTAPRSALAIRQTLHTHKSSFATQFKILPWQNGAIQSVANDVNVPFFIAFPTTTHLDDIATELYHAAPDNIARLSAAICHQLAGNHPKPETLADDAQAISIKIATALRTAKRPLIVSGCQLGNVSILHAAAALAQALNQDGCAPTLLLTVPECNSLGLALMQPGSIQDAFNATSPTSASTLIILENDLYRRAPRPTVNQFLQQFTTIITLDHTSTNTTAKSGITLPCANFAECEGTLVNNEGRAQRSFQSVIPNSPIQPSWLWLNKIAKALQHSTMEEWKSCDDVIRAITTTLPIFSAIGKAAPSGHFRIAGSRIRSEPHRFSGRTAVNANQTMHEPKAPSLAGSPFSSTMEGYYGQLPAPLIPFLWAPGWNSGQSLHKFQDEAQNSIRGGDAGIRLLEPCARDAEKTFLPTMPPAFNRLPDKWLTIPRMHIFGSEELSAKSPPVAELCNAPYLSLNTEDAKTLNAQPGAIINVIFESEQLQLPLVLAPELPSGIAAISAGLPETAGLPFPAWVALQLVSDTGGLP